MITDKQYKIPTIKLSYVSDKEVEHPQIKMSSDMVNIFRKTYEEGEVEYRESFKVAYLKQNMKVLGIQTISTGGTSSTIVDKKILFTGALLANASFIILCHNHPSGNLRPSSQDDTLTRGIVEGAKILDLKVLDHVIITADGHYSYADEGKI